MKFTFKGGVHIPQSKNTADKPIKKFPAPQKVTISLSQHTGRYCTPCVSVGDIVDRGQIIGNITNGIGCPVHASVSGRVTAIGEVRTATGKSVPTVEIENDGEMRLCSEIAPYNKPFDTLTAKKIIETVRTAGIVDTGDTPFPAYAKIKSCVGKVDRLIINCVESEPYLTANHRLVLENPQALINGIKILLRAFDLPYAEIAVEDSRSDVIKLLENITATTPLISVKVVKTKYPQGNERLIVQAIAQREIPEQKLPVDVGCVVFNAQTCIEIFKAFAYGTPHIDKVVTVDGDCIKEPASILCPIGTSYKELIEFCKASDNNPELTIKGGPMTGEAVCDPNASVTKDTSAILVFSKNKNQSLEQGSCIRCGKCVSACPANLMPNYIAQYSLNKKYEECEKHNVMSCIECGACSYVCPEGIPIASLNHTAKTELKSKKKPKNKKANITAAPPHIKHPDTTKSFMLDVLIALMPALIWSIYAFGLRPLTLTFLSIASCVIFEHLFQRFTHRPITIFDWSAAVTGMLLAFTLPASVPLWTPVMGAFFAIIIAKQLFGGIGKNIVNPAIAARLLLSIIWPSKMSAFTQPLTQKLSAIGINVGNITASTTPLASIKAGITPEASLFDMFIGNVPGTIGEVSALLLILGGLYLLARRVITPHIPLAYIGTVALLTFTSPQLQTVQSYEFMLMELFSGALILGAFFMATDYTTSPVTPKGKVIYGIGCALITVLIRYFGKNSDGVYFAIFIMNLLVWCIDKFIRPRIIAKYAKTKNDKQAQKQE